METATEAAAEETGGAPAVEVKRISSSMRVMVAVDDSEGSLYAIRWVLDNLVNVVNITATNEPSEGESGMITLVHVQQPFHPHIYPAGPGGVAFYSTPQLLESVRKAQAEESAALLSRALQICKDKMVKAETLILEGDPKDLICQATEQMQVDLLVVGSRGLGTIQRAFLGSVSDYCAHHAKCPILIVRPPKGSSKSK